MPLTSRQCYAALSLVYKNDEIAVQLRWKQVYKNLGSRQLEPAVAGALNSGNTYSCA